jgi:phosphohistidine phosphatase
MAGSVLMLMRHAKSDWPVEECRDFDRPLAPRGVRDAPRVGKWLRRHGLVPDRIVSSPAERARATAERVAGKLRIPGKRIVFEPRIYEAGLRRLLEVVSEYGKDSGTLLLVGHNPGLEELLAYLADAEPPRDPAGKLLTAGAVAVLEFDRDIVVKPRSAHLRRLVRPRELRRAPDDGG